MRIKRYIITLIFLLFGVGVSHSQEKVTEISINFRVNSIVIDSSYLDNATRLQETIEFLRSIRQDSTINITKITLCGSASPEGNYQLNRKLARGRLSAFEKVIRNEISIADSLISYNDNYIPWEYLKSQVQDSELPRKEEIIAIMEEDARLVDYNSNSQIDHRILKIRALDGGKIWQQMHKLFFERMRNAIAIFVTYKKELPSAEELVVVTEPEPEPEPIVEVKEEVSEVAVEKAVVPAPIMDEWTRKLYLKTNAIGLGMAMANIAAEVDLTKHLSFTLPIYYSAWNYFKSTIKFRTFAIQPEVRYWLSENNNGFFAGAHFGLAYYNFAFDGDYRYQDHNRETPAIGGGISVGYRMPISKNQKWHLEFALGAGVYGLHYDKFHNTPKTKYGLMIDSSQKTYWGLDQAAISFSYMFDLNKKGGKR